MPRKSKNISLPSAGKLEDFAIAILAAGKGTRLRSKHPKVLHAVGGRPLLSHVVEAARQVVPANRIFAIIGHVAAVAAAKLPPSSAAPAMRLCARHRH